MRLFKVIMLVEYSKDFWHDRSSNIIEKIDEYGIRGNSKNGLLLLSMTENCLFQQMIITLI